MIRVAGFDIDGSVNYIQGGQYAEVEIGVPASAKLSDEDIDKIKKANTLEEIFLEYGETVTHVGTYALYGWRKVEKEWDGTMRISWQTSRETDVTSLKEQLAAAKEENEILTRALLELADIVGGKDG